ncbi:MAG: PQQ-binding-like beta-propeller repeat protein [Verrucomicrobiales bacterium]|nr:PQQ-binding-like beta-propeller repeat protein [Verrucomicrobiales bacterium]
MKKLGRLVFLLFKYALLLVCLAIAPLLIYQQFATEFWFRYWMLIMAPMIAILLLIIWYLVFGNAKVGTRFKRMGFLLLGIVVASFVFRFLFVYDGSTSGGSMPKYKFRFSSTETDEASEVAVVEPETARTDVPVPEGVIDSPRFLGPKGDGVWPDPIASFDFSQNPPEELWRQPIGEGWSSYAVVGGRAITQEQRGDDELVTCYELVSGELLWAHTDPDSRFTKSAEMSVEAVMGGEGPRSTPTVHGQRVFSLGSTGILNCLDLQTGENIWTQNVIADFGAGLPKWGKSAGPLVIEEHNLVVVTGPESSPAPKGKPDTYRGPTLIAFALDSGEPVWEYEGTGASYSSPRLIDLAGETQLVSVNGRNVTGHDPATGDEKWRFDWPGPFPKVGQPIEAGDDRVLVSASYSVGSYLLQIREDEGSWTVEPVWKSTRLKTKFSSAIIHEGIAYALNEGRLTCVNMETGKAIWRAPSGKYGFGQNLLVGDQLLIQAEEGDVAIVETNPEEFVETATVDALSAMTWNTPTLAGRYLLVRNGEEAVCYKLAAKK